MKVQILTVGRFHFFNLARQIHKYKKLDKIFSGYPYKYIKNEKNIPKNKYISLFNLSFYSFIFVVLFSLKKLNIKYLSKFENYLSFLLNKLVFNNFKKYIKEKTILISNSGFGLESAIKVKKLNGLFVCDRGAAHIKFQDKILRNEHLKYNINYTKITPEIINREISEYKLADVIAVPSSFVKKTFIKNGISKEKIFVNPLGVNNKIFHYHKSKKKMVHLKYFL